MPREKPKSPKKQASKPAANTTNTTNTTPHAATAPRAPATRADIVLAGLAPEQPALTHLQRSTFAAKYTDAACEEMGSRTRSEGVLGDAVGWAPIMAKALKNHPATLRRYSTARFAWFLACVRALADARELQRTQGGGALASRAQAEKSEKAALAARNDLLETLEELTDGNAPEQKILTAATGMADRPDRIVLSIGSLAKLARDWLNRSDGASIELVQSVGLTLAEVESTEKAAEELAAATADKTMEGRVTTRDTPAINRVEGRLLCEMKAAARIFARANTRNKEVPKLVPGEATRNVLAPRAGKAPKDAGNGEPVNGATGTGAGETGAKGGG